MSERPTFPPRLIRLRDVSHYLGMDRNRFNQEVRPQVTEIRIGRQGIASTALNWTPGWTTIRPATGVPPLNREEQNYGTQKEPRAS